MNKSLGEYVEGLRRKGCRVDLTVEAESYKLFVTNEAGTREFEAKTVTELLHLAQSVDATESVEPTEGCRTMLEYLAACGSQGRFLALTAGGEAVIDHELDVPIFHRQRAAAVRNGRAAGAAAVIDRMTLVVTPIP